ncbi:MAG: phosphotransferase [Actinobacteria bacterium]|nr:phosphotransferase [Actinomycetota bacterium]
MEWSGDQTGPRAGVLRRGGDRPRADQRPRARRPRARRPPGRGDDRPYPAGEFHADLHPGNGLLGDDGTICIIDFGSTGHLDPVQRMAIFQMMAAATAGDAAGLHDAERVATMGDDIVDDDAVLEQALARFLAKHVVSGKDLDASALNDLIPLLATFDIRMPSELTMFFRAIVRSMGPCAASSRATHSSTP